MLFIESEYKKIEETTDKYKKQKYWKIAVGLNQVLREKNTGYYIIFCYYKGGSLKL